jgi:hypothetical protein
LDKINERAFQLGEDQQPLVAISKDKESGLRHACNATHRGAQRRDGCYRRAMIGDQTFEGRNENLGQANKLGRT